MKTDIMERVPPNSPDDESVILGAMMVDSEVCKEVMGEVTEGDFYNDRNRRIFRAIESLYLDGKAVDLVSVYNQMERPEDIEPRAIQEMIDCVVSVKTAGYHARQVKDLRIKRNIIMRCEEAQIKAYEYGSKSEDILLELESQLLELQNEVTEEMPIHVRDYIPLYADEIEKRTQGRFFGLTTGYPRLDEYLGELEMGEMTVIGADTSVGKTAMAISIMVNVLKKGYGCCYFSLEMNKEQIVSRFLSQMAGVNYRNIRSGQLTKCEYKRWTKSMSDLVERNLFIHDFSFLTVSKLRSWLAKLSRKYDLKLVAVDYLQIMTPTNPNVARANQMGEMTRTIKNMAGDLKCHVLLLSQINREGSKNRFPELYYLKESSSIEQDADKVILLSRRKDEYICSVNVAKNRDGKTGTLEMEFVPETMRFESIMDSEQ